MPYPNESACRIKDPRKFQKGSFRRMKVGKLHLIIGRLLGKTTTTTQAFRYPKSDWTVEEARAHCKKKGGSFEPAKKGKSATIQEITPEELKELADTELQGLHEKCHQAYKALFIDERNGTTKEKDRQGSPDDSTVPDPDGGGSGTK